LKKTARNKQCSSSIDREGGFIMWPWIIGIAAVVVLVVIIAIIAKKKKAR
jgi:hypothetical protein